MSLLAHVAALIGAGGGAPVITPAMLDPLNKGTGVNLSNLNLTATKASGGVAWRMARSTVGKTAGKYYFEVTWDHYATSSSIIGVGVGDQDASVNTFFGSDNNGLIILSTGAVYKNSALSTTIASSSQGSTGCIALDVDNSLVWYRVGSGNWNNNPSANPVTGVGGIAFSPSMSGTIYPAVGVQTSPNDKMSINFGPTFTHTPPSGFGILGTVGAPSLLGLGAITEDA